MSYESEFEADDLPPPGVLIAVIGILVGRLVGPGVELFITQEEFELHTESGGGAIQFGSTGGALSIRAVPRDEL